MARLVKIFDEKQLLVNLQADTLILIRDCQTIQPIKIFVQCHDILRLTWDIQLKYPREYPEDPECDETALLYLRVLTQELFIGHGAELPKPGFDHYEQNIRRLLRVFRVPKKGFENAKLETGEEIPQETLSDLPKMYVVDASAPGTDPDDTGLV